MRRLVITAAAVCLLAAAGCGSTGTPAAGPPHTPSPLDSGMLAPGQQMPSPSPTSTTATAEAAACHVLAAMKFDITTMNAASTTQDQINAALNLLPSGDKLGTDTVAAEGEIVDADIDAVGLAGDAAGYRAKYDADVSTLEGDLRTVLADCNAVGVPFSINLQHQ